MGRKYCANWASERKMVFNSKEMRHNCCCKGVVSFGVGCGTDTALKTRSLGE